MSPPVIKALPVLRPVVAVRYVNEPVEVEIGVPVILPPVIAALLVLNPVVAVM